MRACAVGYSGPRVLQTGKGPSSGEGGMPKRVAMQTRCESEAHECASIDHDQRLLRRTMEKYLEAGWSVGQMCNAGLALRGSDGIGCGPPRARKRLRRRRRRPLRLRRAAQDWARALQPPSEHGRFSESTRPAYLLRTNSSAWRSTSRQQIDCAPGPCT